MNNYKRTERYVGIIKILAQCIPTLTSREKNILNESFTQKTWKEIGIENDLGPDRISRILLGAAQKIEAFVREIAFLPMELELFKNENQFLRETLGLTGPTDNTSLVERARAIRIVDIPKQFLCTGAKNRLIDPRIGVTVLGDLEKYPKSYFPKIRNFGKTAFDQLVDLMTYYKLSFKEEE